MSDGGSRRKPVPTRPPSTPPLVARSTLLALAIAASSCGADKGDTAGAKAKKTEVKKQPQIAPTDGAPQVAPVQDDDDKIAPQDAPQTVTAPQLPPQPPQQMPPVTNDAPQIAPVLPDPPQVDAPQLAPPQDEPPQATIGPEELEEQTFRPLRAKIEAESAKGAQAFTSLSALATATLIPLETLKSSLAQTDFYLGLSAATQARVGSVLPELTQATAAEQTIAGKINAAAAANKDVFATQTKLATEAQATESDLDAALQKTVFYQLLTETARTKAASLVQSANLEPN